MTNYDILKEYEAHQTPVPSYKELENMNEAVNQAISANIKLVKRVKLLEELLEECRHIIGIEKDFASCHFEEYTLVELLDKIDEALR